jgi:glycosidase
MMLLCCGMAAAQERLTIRKVDPPNWWAAMPKPMLLVYGEGLDVARFQLSDRSIKIEKVQSSANGHYAQLWLSAAPMHAETIQIEARSETGSVKIEYSFLPQRPSTDGFAGFSSRDVLYLIMTDRFADGDLKNDGAAARSAAMSSDATAERAKPRGWHGGDLRGVMDHIDYLQQLGVTAVWITPVYQNHEADSYHGYGATDLYQVDEHYGTLDDLKGLAAALHAHGMKLVLDTVPNHVGPAHPWVKDEPTPAWFHGTAAHHLKGETNFRALIDPHAAERDRIGTLDGWFADALPDMDTDDATVALYLRQNAVWWIEQTGADGLRIDTFPYVNRAFWNAFNGELKELFPRLTEVGEVFNSDAEITSSFAGGVTRAGVDTHLTTPFDFPTYFAVRDVFAKGAPMSRLADVLGQDALYPHPEALVPFIGNHDTTRFLDAAHGDLAAERLAFAYVMTTRGMPQIYSGDEIAMHGGDDPDNRRDFPGGFPGDQANAFTAAGRSPEQQQMYLWVSSLAKERREHASLRCGAEQVLGSGPDWVVYLRDAKHAEAAACDSGETGSADDRVLVAIHRGAKASFSLPIDQTWLVGCQLGAPDFAGQGTAATMDGNTLKLQSAADDVLIATCK